jgi:hypothetical protein
MIYSPSPLPEGKHVVTVANIFYGEQVLNRRLTQYFDIKFENQTGFIHQKFFNNELGRDAYMKPLFQRFNIEPDFYDTQSLLKTFVQFKGREVSLTVYKSDNGTLETMAWLPVYGRYGYRWH